MMMMMMIMMMMVLVCSSSASLPGPLRTWVYVVPVRSNHTTTPTFLDRTGQRASQPCTSRPPAVSSHARPRARTHTARQSAGVGCCRPPLHSLAPSLSVSFCCQAAVTQWATRLFPPPSFLLQLRRAGARSIRKRQGRALSCPLCPGGPVHLTAANTLCCLPPPIAILREGLSLTAATEMRTSLMTALVSIARDHCQCTMHCATQLVDVWATP